MGDSALLNILRAIVFYVDKGADLVIFTCTCSKQASF